MSGLIHFNSSILDEVGREYIEMLKNIDEAECADFEKRHNKRQDEAKKLWRNDDRSEAETIVIDEGPVDYGQQHNRYGSLVNVFRETMKYVGAEFIEDRKKRAEGQQDKQEFEVKCPACMHVASDYVEAWDREARENGCHVDEICNCMRRTQPKTSFGLVRHVYKLQFSCQYHGKMWWYLVRAATHAMQHPHLGRTALVVYILKKAAYGYKEGTPDNSVWGRSRHQTWSLEDYDTDSKCNSSKDSSRATSPTQNNN